MVVPADLLGSADFRHRHGVRLAYVAGSMYRGISSPDMVVRMGRAGLLAFLGSFPYFWLAMGVLYLLGMGLGWHRRGWPVRWTRPVSDSESTGCSA